MCLAHHMSPSEGLDKLVKMHVLASTGQIGRDDFSGGLAGRPSALTSLARRLSDCAARPAHDSYAPMGSRQTIPEDEPR